MIFLTCNNCRNCINLRPRSFYCLHTLRCLKHHSLKFTDCEAIEVAFPVVPVPIGIHLYTFFCAFAIRLILVPIGVIQRRAIHILKLSRGLILFNAQIGITVILLHNPQNSSVLLLIHGSCKSSSSLLTGL